MAADADLRLIVVPQKDWDEYSEDIRVYNARRREQGKEARRPIVGCNVYCTNDLDDAQETFWDAVHDHAMSAIHHYELTSRSTSRKWAATTTTPMLLTESGTEAPGPGTPQPHPDMGHPGDVLGGHPGNPGQDPPEEMYGVFKFGAMPLEKSIESMKLFAKEVLPEIHKDQLMDPL